MLVRRAHLNNRKHILSSHRNLQPAGTVGDLYKALAQACGVPAEQPNSVLLLVDIYQGQVYRKYTDLQEPLADAIRQESLLAYKYACSAKGPASGGKELHVFQR